MSEQTRVALDDAVRAHIADETGGDLVLGWALTAGIVEHHRQSRTTWLSTNGLARYEVRGLLAEASTTIAHLGMHEESDDD